MPYETRHGVFVARQRLTAERARLLAEAGLRVVVLQVEWQRSTLPQRTVQQLRDEQRVARAAGLEVWWWGWCCPTLPPEAGRLRPSGARALGQRLDALVAELGPPAGFFVDAEVGGRWTPKRLPELPDVAAAARAAGMPRVGLTSHGLLGRPKRPAKAWAAHAFDVGAPQLYENDGPIEVGWTRRCLSTWDDAPVIWPVLGCGAESPASQMRGDLWTLESLGVRPTPGALWWSSTTITREGRLAAAVP